MYSIREARPEEAFAVASYMKKFEDETSHVKVDPQHAGKIYESMIRNGSGHMFILEDDNDSMVGGLGCVVGPDLHYPRTVAVETYWYVEPDHRGCGKMLLEFFEDWAKNNGCDAIAMIYLSDSMPDSLEQLYIRRGFKLVEKHFVKEV